MDAKREARRIGMLFLAAVAAGCAAESRPGGEGGAAQQVPPAASESRAHGQARVEKIVARSRMARDPGTIAAHTPLGGPVGSRFADVFEPGLAQRLEPARGGFEPVLSGALPIRAR